MPNNSDHDKYLDYVVKDLVRRELQGAIKDSGDIGMKVKLDIKKSFDEYEDKHKIINRVNKHDNVVRQSLWVVGMVITLAIGTLWQIITNILGVGK